MSDPISNPSIERWEAVYYPNPIPLSSRCLLAAALLFDRLHFPGVHIPQVRLTDAEKHDWTTNHVVLAPEPAQRNLMLWGIEQPGLSDLIFLPDSTVSATLNDDVIETHARQLIEDTYGCGTWNEVEAVFANEVVPSPHSSDTLAARTWPFYQAGALHYARQKSLPLVSDDLRSIPPLPAHPAAPEMTTKHLAQQLAVEALSLVLPHFRSVTPPQVVDFRSEMQPIAKSFRVEMVRLTSELHSAIASGASDADLQNLCKGIAETRVLPALNDLSRQLKEPLRPWHKVALEVAEAGLAAAASTVSPSLTVGWALLRGSKILSEYVELYKDREGKRKSGISLLLNVNRAYGSGMQSDISAWDRVDWRCSGFVRVDDPGAPIIPENKELAVIAQSKGLKVRTMRNIYQTKTKRVILMGHHPA